MIKKGLEINKERGGLPEFRDTLPVFFIPNHKFLKKDAIIVFLTDFRMPGEILDVRIYDTSTRPSIVSDISTLLEMEFKIMTLGNCNQGWDGWNLCDILFKFGFQYTTGIAVETKLLKELSQVEEWHDIVREYLLVLDVDLDDKAFVL